jgi:hypothetical protein
MPALRTAIGRQPAEVISAPHAEYVLIDTGSFAGKMRIASQSSARVIGSHLASIIPRAAPEVRHLLPCRSDD